MLGKNRAQYESFPIVNTEPKSTTISCNQFRRIFALNLPIVFVNNTTDEDVSELQDYMYSSVFIYFQFVFLFVFSSLGFRIAQLLAPRRPLRPVRRERKTVGAQVSS